MFSRNRWQPGENKNSSGIFPPRSSSPTKLPVRDGASPCHSYHVAVGSLSRGMPLSLWLSAVLLCSEGERPLPTLLPGSAAELVRMISTNRPLTTAELMMGGRHDLKNYTDHSQSCPACHQPIMTATLLNGQQKQWPQASCDCTTTAASPHLNFPSAGISDIPDCFQGNTMGTTGPVSWEDRWSYLFPPKTTLGNPGCTDCIAQSSSFGAWTFFS